MVSSCHWSRGADENQRELGTVSVLITVKTCCPPIQARSVDDWGSLICEGKVVLYDTVHTVHRVILCVLFKTNRHAPDCAQSLIFQSSHAYRLHVESKWSLEYEWLYTIQCMTVGFEQRSVRLVLYRVSNFSFFFYKKQHVENTLEVCWLAASHGPVFRNCLHDMWLRSLHTRRK